MEKTGRNVLELAGSITSDKCNLIGYSMGGRLGLYLAVNYPERFNKIIIESSSPGLKSEDERLKRIENDSRVAEKLVLMSFDKFLEFWYSQPLFSTIDKTGENFRKLINRRMENNPEKLVLSLKMMGTGVMPSLWDLLYKIKAETLLIVGEKDSKFTGIAEDMMTCSDRLKIAIVNGAGHNVHIEKEDEFIEITANFLNK